MGLRYPARPVLVTNLGLGPYRTLRTDLRLGPYRTLRTDLSMRAYQEPADFKAHFPWSAPLLFSAGLAAVLSLTLQPKKKKSSQSCDGYANANCRNTDKGWAGRWLAWAPTPGAEAEGLLLQVQMM